MGWQDWTSRQYGLISSCQLAAYVDPPPQHSVRQAESADREYHKKVTAFNTWQKGKLTVLCNVAHPTRQPRLLRMASLKANAELWLTFTIHSSRSESGYLPEGFVLYRNGRSKCSGRPVDYKAWGPVAHKTPSSLGACPTETPIDGEILQYYDTNSHPGDYVVILKHVEQPNRLKPLG
jgi:hypothetical protein